MSKKDKKPLGIYFVIPDMGPGGAERVVSTLANRYAEEGYRVGIVYFLNETSDYPLSDKVEKIFFCRTSKGGAVSKISAFRSLIKELKRFCTPVLIPFHDTCLKYCDVSSLGTGVPVVACERNDPGIKGNSFIRKMKSGLPYRMADRAVFQTPGAAEYYSGAVRKKGSVIFNPLNEGAVKRWQGEESTTLVSVGRLEAQKNHAMLIDAFRILKEEFPDLRLDIYGEGSLRAPLQAKIDSAGLSDSVTLKGLTDKIGDVLSSSRAFVLSSDYEGMSNALIEAMASGMPVVSTDHPAGGAGALITPGVNGLLVPVGDAEAFASATSKILRDPALARELGKEAEKIKGVLSAETVAAKWLEVIKVAAGIDRQN